MTIQELQTIVAQNVNVLRGLKWTYFSDKEITTTSGKFTFYLTETGHLQIRRLGVLAEMELPDLADLYKMLAERVRGAALDELAACFQPTAPTNGSQTILEIQRGIPANGSKYTPDTDEENDAKPEMMRGDDPANTSAHGRPGWQG